MTKHIHAELMLQYAQDALTTDKPWELWEFRSAIWNVWRPVIDNFAFSPEYEYRHKPGMVTRTITYPKPLTELPDGCDQVWVPRINWAIVDIMKLTAPDSVEAAIKSGFAHLTKEAALAHARALVEET